MKGALDVTVAIFVLCGWRFLNHFHIVSETPYSCDTVGCELRRVILCSLLCPETDKNTRRKARLCVYFKVAHNSFQDFPRRTTLYQLMLQSWYQKNAQSLVNTLVLFS